MDEEDVPKIALTCMIAAFGAIYLCSEAFKYGFYRARYSDPAPITASDHLPRESDLKELTDRK